jgi:hypothetical protein
MRVISKASFALIGILATIALTTSVVDARTINAKRFGGARASVPAPSPAPHGSSSVPYGPETAAYPSGHGGKTGSPDFQLVG